MTGNVPVEEVVKNAHLLGELVGLGLRSVNTCPMELNLQPTSVVNAQKIASRRPYLVGAGLCLLLALLGAWLYFLRADHIKNVALGEIRTRNASMGEFEKQDNSVKSEIMKIKQDAEPLLQTVDDRQYWARAITALHAALPEKYIWITLLEPTSGGKPVVMGDPGKPLVGPVPGGAATPAPGARPGTGAAASKGPVIDGLHVKGLYLENPSADAVVTAFVNNLRKSDFFNIDKTNDNNVIKNRSPQNTQDWAFDYDLELKLAQPLPAP